MLEPSPGSPQAWRRVLAGLAFTRRGLQLAVYSGLLVLGLGASARAGCANPLLPEVRSLMEYQDLVFHAALWLGFTMVVGGLWWTALLPGGWSERMVPLGMGGLVAVALLLMALQAEPGRLPALDAPAGGSGALIGAVVGTAALAGCALVVMQLGRKLDDDNLVRRAAAFGGALLVAAAANAEAAAGLLLPDPVDALYAYGVVAAVDGAACFWLASLLRHSEDLVRSQLGAAAAETFEEE